MADLSERKLLSILIRQSDHVRFGVFETGDIRFPLLMAEQDRAGGFDFTKPEWVPFAEAFSILMQINGAAGAH